MLRKYTLVSLLLLLGFLNKSNGQTCPDNIDFEWGTTMNWSFFTGMCCPIVTGTSTAALVNRHELTTGPGLDYYGGFPIVAPSGGAFSMRLGNDMNGAEAEKARYFVRIPTGSANYSLVYRYAVVLDDPSHSPADQPRFTVTAVDSATSAPIPCAAYSYVATSGLPGFMTSSVASRYTSGGVIRYKGWTTATINLSGLGGTTVQIDFASGDCAAYGHFGYGYFDMNCGLFSVGGITCDDTATTLTLSAPFGFEFYRWYDSATFTTVYGTTQTITIPIPPAPVTIAVILTPYVGYGCPDTLFARISPNHLVLNPTPDTLICNGAGLTITSGATDVALPLSYSWAPATGLSCTTCANPFASPLTATTYTVTVTNGNGCVKDTTITVAVGLVTSTVTKVDDSCFGYNNGSATDIVTAGIPPFTYSWSTTPVQTTPTASGLYAGTYTVTVTDASGCQDVQTATIIDGPRTVLHVVNAVNPDSCDIANGRITLDSLIAGNTFTIHYLFNGVYQTQTKTANAAWQVTLTGLANGTYSNIGVITNSCPYNIAGPVVLNDPPNPSVPAMSSNSPVCLGSAMTLSATSTTGVSYNWSGPGGFTSASQTPVIPATTYADSGKYVVVVMINNCYSRDSIRTRVIPLPFPSGASNTPVCTGDTLFIQGSSSNGASSYTWNGPDGFYSYTQNPFIDHVKMPAAGTYTVTVNLNGCFATATTNVVINPTPDAPTVTDLEYCQYDVAAPLTAGGSGLLWYSGANGGTGSAVAPVPSTQVEGTKTYYVSQVVAGCESGRSPIKVYVDYLANPVLVTSDSVICKGTDIQFNASEAGSNMTGLTWVWGNGDSSKGQNPIVHSFDKTGKWSVTATAEYKVCPDKVISRGIMVFPSPSVYLGADTSICPGGVPIILNDFSNAGNKDATWRWSTGSSNSSIKITSPGSYYVKVSINGCYATDTLVVSNDCYMNLPNVFTPNGDGLNDYFFPRQLLTKGLSAFSMEIFNRWGQMVFSTNTLDGSGWDGKLNNVAQPVGVYIYVIDATFKDGQKERHKGNVTLLR